MTLMVLSTAFSLSSCDKSDDGDWNVVNVTLNVNGSTKSGETLYLFLAQSWDAGLTNRVTAKPATTDANGVAKFIEVTPGDWYVVYFAGNQTFKTAVSFAVGNSTTKAVTLNVTTDASNSSGGNTSSDNNGSSTSKKYSIKQVVKETVMTVHSQTYTGAASNRSYVTVQLPKNTISWYYAISSQFTETGTPMLGLFGGLTKSLDPTLGLLANSVSSLSAPTGTADVNVYFIGDIDNLNIFNTKSGQFTTYVEGTRKGINSGIVDIEVPAANGATWYLGLENPDLKDAIYVTIEVCALVYE